MTKENKLRKLLETGKPTLSTRLHSTWPLVAEAVGALGRYDYFEFVENMRRTTSMIWKIWSGRRNCMVWEA